MAACRSEFTAEGMRQVQYQADFAARPERVFAAVTDPRKPFLTSNPMMHMELGSPQNRGVGTIYRWSFTLPLWPMLRFDEAVTEWEEGRRIAYRAISGWEMRAKGEFLSAPTGTHYVFTLEYRLPWPWNRLIPGWLEALALQQVVANLRQQVEAERWQPDGTGVWRHRRCLRRPGVRSC
ncbi:MAG: SRPBCC family protein [Chloroflexi bacterium]|nr:SRPBCC family protein [Chloroflexota bacterium]